jgi:hypothetical protein
MYRPTFAMSYQSGNKADRVARVISTKTQQSIVTLQEYSFKEMLRLLGGEQDLNLRPVTEKFIDDGIYNTIMFTVSSSDFRLVALLHFLPKEEQAEKAWEYLRLEQTVNTQQYHDYICELGNNFCGAICRVLNAANYSTGMSTPAILANINSLENLCNIGVDFGCHVAAGSDKNPLFCASVFLILNKSMTADLDIPIPATTAETENQGELEFF